MIVRRRLFVIWVGVVMLACGFLTIGLRYDTHAATTGIMTPAIQLGETILVDRIATSVSPARGDVVLLDGAIWPGVPAENLFVLRVVAVAGDRIVCCSPDGSLVLNGEVLKETYASGANGTFGKFDVSVPAGRFFVLGDERDRARDSRELLSPTHVHADHVHGLVSGNDAEHATVAVDAVRGKVLTVVSPPWRLRGVSAAPISSPHFSALAAIGLGGLLVILAAAPPAFRITLRAYRRIRRRGNDSW